jgi:hypothetical protein
VKDGVSLNALKTPKEARKQVEELRDYLVSIKDYNEQ